jgi:hypothetical protein
MSERLIVRNLPIPPTNLDGAAFVFCLGYEARSRFAAEAINWSSAKTLAIEYSVGQVLSFEENKRFARQKDFKTIPDRPDIVETELRRMIAAVRAEGRSAKIAVDVSSMDRSLMSRVLLTVLDCLMDGETMLVLYSPSAFVQPKNNLVPIRNSSAAHPAIAGQIAPPDTGRVALLGLGYEYGVSLNILEAHEPDISFIFRPNGVDDRFQQAVREANFGFDFGERNYEIVDYFLHDMAGAYDDISSLIVASKHNSSIVAVPMGPKILSATMILAGRLHQPQVSVLRYSVASGGQYQDIAAEGIIVGVAVSVVKDREIAAIHNIMARQSR